MGHQCEKLGWRKLKIIWKETYDAGYLSNKLIIDGEKELPYIGFQQKSTHCQHPKSRIYFTLGHDKAKKNWGTLLNILRFFLSFSFLEGGRCGPTWAMAFSFMRFLDHTHRRTTVCGTTLDGCSASRRDLYLTTHNIPSPAGFKTTISAGERP